MKKVLASVLETHAETTSDPVEKVQAMFGSREGSGSGSADTNDSSDARAAAMQRTRSITASVAVLATEQQILQMKKRCSEMKAVWL